MVIYNAEGDLYLLDPQGGEPSLFKEKAGIPSWGQDGGSLVYGAGGKIHIESAQTGEAFPITGPATFDTNPIWLPAPYSGEGKPVPVADDLLMTESEVDEAIMRTTIEKLKNIGYAPGTSGTYIPLPDVEREWAQLGWYEWGLTGETPRNFVLSALVTWESASETPDWNLAGCGVIFRENGPENFYAIFNTLDGRTRFDRTVNGASANLVINKPGFSSFDQTGQSSILLVANGSQFIFFVDGSESFSRADMGLSEGALGLAVLSGTNQGFGTRCTWSNIELFEFEPGA